jgi:hypothetical protein
MSKKVVSIASIIVGSLLIFFNSMGLIGNLTFGLFDSLENYKSDKEFDFLIYVFIYYNEMCILLIIFGLILFLFGLYLRKNGKMGERNR